MKKIILGLALFGFTINQAQTDPKLYDIIDAVSEERITGHYTFKATSFFYQGHFKGNPITPGVILTECMAQIGLVCLGIFLVKEELQPQVVVIAGGHCGRWYQISYD